MSKNRASFTLTADYNAAKNIGLKRFRWAQTSSSGGTPVDVRLHRETLNLNGIYEPVADSGQNGSPRESYVRNGANGEAMRR